MFQRFCHSYYQGVLNGVVTATLLVAVSIVAIRPSSAAPRSPVFPRIEAPNGTGISRTITTRASFDSANPYFQSLGTNGRSCATCHPLSEGANMNPEFAQSLFDLTKGLDPLFATVDGTNSPNADMSTREARSRNTSMLRGKGLFRISLKVPANAEFIVESVDDPYGFANSAEISAFRRPLPASNLRFLSTVMWDGREFLNEGSVQAALRSQVKDAVLGHMQASAPPTEVQITQIVDFEKSLFTTQVFDNAAGSLETPHVHAGPEWLVRAPFSPGLNRFVANGQRVVGFNPRVFSLFGFWLSPQKRGGPNVTVPQRAIARGERIFNGRSFLISGVAGFNDRFAGPRERRQGSRGLPDTGVRGTCSSCHNLPGLGSNSLPILMNTGISDGARRTADMPLYTLRNAATGQRVQTTDPGAAMTTGKWADIGKFKTPSLRGLETHSPYMHNGFSGDLLEVINFYDARFSIGLTAQEKDDLKVFLQAL